MFTKQGKIIDETGMGIPGVHITVEGDPLTGTTTDIDGNYSLLIGSLAKLNFSHLGKEIKSIVASSVPAVLKLDTSFDMLDEVTLDIPKKKNYLGWKIFGGIAGALLLFGLVSNKEEEKKEKNVKKVVL